jgi:hypothetical protein
MIGKESVDEIAYQLNQMAGHSNISVKKLVLHLMGATILFTLLLLSKFLISKVQETLYF